MLSRYAGPQEGIYTINLCHMVVNKPRNINDIGLVDGIANVELALSLPTMMSFSLQRIRLAEISREVTDHTPLSISRSAVMPESQIIENDAKFDEYVKGIPATLWIDGTRPNEALKAGAGDGPGTLIQRYLLTSMVHAHRCKLHVHYLSRSSTASSSS